MRTATATPPPFYLFVALTRAGVSRVRPSIHVIKKKNIFMQCAFRECCGNQNAAFFSLCLFCFIFFYIGEKGLGLGLAVCTLFRVYNALHRKGVPRHFWAKTQKYFRPIIFTNREDAALIDVFEARSSHLLTGFLCFFVENIFQKSSKTETGAETDAECVVIPGRIDIWVKKKKMFDFKMVPNAFLNTRGSNKHVFFFFTARKNFRFFFD